MSMHDAAYRHAQYYSNELQILEGLVDANEVETEQAFLRFDLDREQIMRGYHWVRSQSSNSKQMMDLREIYPIAAPQIFMERQDQREWMQWLQDGLDVACRRSNREYEAKYLSYLASAYGTLGNLAEAEDYYLRAIEIAKQLGDERLVSIWTGNLGGVLLSAGMYDRASVMLKMALAWSRQEENNLSERELNKRGRLESICLYNLGRMSNHMGNYQEGLNYAEKGIVLARGRKNNEGEISALSVKGTCLRYLRQYTKSAECHEKALNIARKYRLQNWEGSELGNLGLVAYYSGDARKALEYYNKALAVQREVGDLYGEANQLGNMGLALSDLGEHDGAMERYQEALAIHRQIGARYYEANQLNNIGLLLYRKNQHEEAKNYFYAALEIYNELKAQNMVQMVRQNLSGIE